MKFLNRFGTLTLMIFASLHVLAQDFSELYEELNPTVVTIYTIETVFSPEGRATSESLGSGVLIDDTGMIMTAAHVVESAEAILVKTYDDQLIEAEVISSVSSADVALIKLKSKPAGINPAKLGSSTSAKIGDQVLIIGAPLGLEHSLSIGHISAKQVRGRILNGEQMEFLQTDASINSGNSGGPMFNTAGELIGIVSSILTQSGGFEGIGFAASIDPAKKILLEGSPFWTGFEGFFLDQQLAEIFNLTRKGGVLVQRVVTNSIADKAGLRGGYLKTNLKGNEVWIGGDIIVSIQELSCNSPHDMDSIKKQISLLKKGDAINVEVIRAGKMVSLTMKFQ